jgi:hypothetical protein
MMNYVEVLRVLRGLRVVAIILGLVVLAAIVLRIILASAASPEALVSRAQFATGARVTTTHLADGTVRTKIFDPSDGTRVTMDDRGYYGKHIVIVEPTTVARDQHRHGTFSIGSMSWDEQSNSNTSTIVVDTNSREDIAVLFGISVPLALIFATIIACALARENEGHLELAWTKPVSRDRFALGAIAVDLAGIAATIVGSVIVFALINLLFQLPHFYLDAAGFTAIVLTFTVPMAWYALLTTASASLKRGCGAVVGTAWPAAFVLPILVGAFSAHHRNSMLGQMIAGVLRTVDTLNPLVYLPSFSSNGTIALHAGLTLVSGTARSAIVTTLVLLLIYIAFAVLQWRRVEA